MPAKIAGMFGRYAELMRGYAMACQKGAERVGGFFAPTTRSKIWQRNQLYRILSSRLMSGYFNSLGTKMANGIALPDYRV